MSPGSGSACALPAVLFDLPEQRTIALAIYIGLQVGRLSSLVCEKLETASPQIDFRVRDRLSNLCVEFSLIYNPYINFDFAQVPNLIELYSCAFAHV